MVKDGAVTIIKAQTVIIRKTEKRISRKSKEVKAIK